MFSFRHSGMVTQNASKSKLNRRIILISCLHYHCDFVSILKKVYFWLVIIKFIEAFFNIKSLPLTFKQLREKTILCSCECQGWNVGGVLWIFILVHSYDFGILKKMSSPVLSSKKKKFRIMFGNIHNVVSVLYVNMPLAECNKGLKNWITQWSAHMFKLV